jgi:hypothetical protein
MSRREFVRYLRPCGAGLYKHEPSTGSAPPPSAAALHPWLHSTAPMGPKQKCVTFRDDRPSSCRDIESPCSFMGVSGTATRASMAVDYQSRASRSGVRSSNPTGFETLATDVNSKGWAGPCLSFGSAKFASCPCLSVESTAFSPRSPRAVPRRTLAQSAGVDRAGRADRRCRG